MGDNKKQPLGFSAQLTIEDFRTLAYEHTQNERSTTAGVKVQDWENKFKKYKTDEERTRGFLELMLIEPRTWEFTDVKFIPAEIRNSGDIDTVQKYLDDNINTMTTLSKAVLIMRLQALHKAKRIQEKAAGEKIDNTLYDKRPKMEFKPFQNYYEIFVDMGPHGQTSGLGCYSTTMELMVKGRGISDITQEELRAYRPNTSEEYLKDNGKTDSYMDQQYNTDEVSSVLEKADATLAFAPNTMLRSFEILPPQKVQDANARKALMNMTFDTYVDNAVILIKEQLFQAIVQDRSPVSVSNGSHYITIVGVRGDNILYKDSGRGDACRDTQSMPLREYVAGILKSKKFNFTISWLSDIKLSKDGKTLYNVPSNYLRMEEDGTLKMPKSLAEEGNWSLSELEHNGIRAGLYGGVDDLPFEREKRDVLKGGVLSVQQVYLPKKLNLPYLKDQAKNRSQKEEDKLKSSTIRLLGHDPAKGPDPNRLDYYDTAKIEQMNKVLEEEKDRQAVAERMKEKLSEYAAGLKRDKYHQPDRDADNKGYIWNNNGAVAAFQLELAYKAIVPLLEAIGTDNANAKLQEIKDRFRNLQERLKSPENALNAEDANLISGVVSDGNGHYSVTLPNAAIKMNGYFKKDADLYDAILLLETIGNCVDFEKDLGTLSQKQVRNRGRNAVYDPTIISSLVEKAQFLADLNSGNFLKLCANNPALYGMINAMTALPTNDKQILNTHKSDKLPEEFDRYIDFTDTIKDNISFGLKLQSMQELSYQNVTRYVADDYKVLSSNLNQAYKNFKGKFPVTADSPASNIGAYISMWNGQRLALSYGFSDAGTPLLGYLNYIGASIDNYKAQGKQVDPELAKEHHELIALFKKYTVDRKNGPIAVLGQKTAMVNKLISIIDKYGDQEVIAGIKDARPLVNSLAKTITDKENALAAGRNIQLNANQNQPNMNNNQLNANQNQPNMNNNQLNTNNNQPNANQNQPNNGQPGTNQNQPNNGQPGTNQNQPNNGQPNANQNQPNNGQPNANNNQPNKGPVKKPATDTPEDKKKADKIRTLYNAITTPEEKLRFLIMNEARLTAYSNVAMKAVSIPEAKMMSELRKNFIRDNFLNTDKKIRDRVFGEFGSILADNTGNICKKWLDRRYEIAAEDPERNNKAYYLAANDARYGAVKQSLNTFLDEARQSMKDSQVMKDDVVRSIKINDKTTMAQLFKAMGWRDDEIELRCKAWNNVKPTDRVIGYYRKYRTAASKADAISAAYQDIITQRLESAIHHERDKYLNDRGFTARQKNRYAVISLKNTQKPSETNIKEWAQKEANVILAGDKVGTYIDFSEDFDKEFSLDAINKRNAENAKITALAASSAERKRRSAEVSYPYLFAKNEDGDYVTAVPTDEQYDQFMYDTGYNTGIEVGNNYVASVEKSLLNNPSVGKAHRNDRAGTLKSLFTLWALGTYDTANMSNFSTLIKNPAMVRKFIEFCDANPTIEATSKAEFEKSVKAWGTVYEKATRKVMKYTIPRVDYSNPSEVRKHFNDIKNLNMLYMDFMQEYDHTFSNRNLGVDGVQTLEDQMGQKKWSRIFRFWANTQGIMSNMNDAYFIKNEIGAWNQGAKYIFVKAAERYAVNEILGEVAGLDIGKASGLASPYNQIGTTIGMIIDHAVKNDGTFEDEYKEFASIDRKVVLNYLTGKDKKTFIRQFKAVFDKMVENSKKFQSELCHMTFKGRFFDNLDIAGMKDELLNIPDNAEGVKAFINNGEILEGRNISRATWVNNQINMLFSEDYKSLTANAGVDKMDAILVDGKTPDELWGKKYADLDDASRELCYKVEVLKKIAEARSSVKAKVVGFGLGGTMAVVGEVALSVKAEELQDIKHNYNVYKSGIKSMLGKLDGIQKALLETHPGFEPENKNRYKEAKSEIGDVGTELFINMETSLNDLIKVMRDNSSTQDKILEAIIKFKTAAETYHKERKSIFGKHSESGQKRLDTSAEAENILSDMLTEYMTLRQIVSSDMIVDKNGTLRNASINGMKNILEHAEQPSKDGIYRLGEVAELGEDDARNRYNAYSEVASALKTGLNGLGKDMAKLMDLPKNPEPSDAALAFITKSYIDKVKSRVNTPENIAEIKNSIEAGFESGSFRKEAEKLAKNPVFKESIRQNVRFDYEEWKKLEENSDKLIAQYKNDLTAITRQGTDLAVYVLTGAVKKENLVKADKDIVEARYQRLGECTAKKILSDPKNRSAVNAIASGRMKYEDVIKNTVTVLKQQKVFTDKSYDEAGLRAKISSDAFKKIVTEDLMKKAQESSKIYIKGASKPISEPVINEGRPIQTSQPKPKTAGK